MEYVSTIVFLILTLCMLVKITNRVHEIISLIFAVQSDVDFERDYLSARKYLSAGSSIADLSPIISTFE